MNLAIPPALDPAAIAKVPTQDRAKQRFEAVLKESEHMLAESGLARFSIPLLAERLDITRGSIYAYFPTHYAILNELVSRYLIEMEIMYRDQYDALMGSPLKDSVRSVVQQAVTFHNSRPVARLLMLGGAVTDASYRAQEMLLARLGQMGRDVWEHHDGGHGIPDDVDIFTLSVDLAVACFRRSVFQFGEITPAYQDAAICAMQEFLEAYLDP